MTRHVSHRWFMLFLLVASCDPLSAQAPADVLRYFGEECSRNVQLVDKNGNVVHLWRTGYRPSWGVHLDEDGTLLRIIRGVGERRVQRVAFDSTLLWDWDSPPGTVLHHDLEPLPNGNVLLIMRERKTVAEAIARGRDPAQIGRPGTVFFWPDVVLEVQPTGPTSGVIVWEWHVWDHLIQDFDPQQAGFGEVANHPELHDINYPRQLRQLGEIEVEFNHMNGLDYDPIHDWIAISVPMQNEIWIVDHSTSTVEAAGHSGGRWGKGGDLLYRWGNPQTYRAGSPAQQILDFQHDPQFVPPGYPGAGHLTLFNNRHPWGRSAVFEIALPVDSSGQFVRPPGGAYGPTAPVWSFSKEGFFSQFMSSAQRLANGNTLICSAEQRWIFEVTTAGEIVWQHRNPTGCRYFHAHHTTRSLWTDRQSLSASTGGTVRFNLETGSSNAGNAYVILGSASGTSPGFAVHGIHLPLNVDGYLLGVLTSIGVGPYAGWLGVLDAGGSASANFVMPPISPLAGIALDHAFAVIDTTTSRINRASNAVPLVLGR